MLKLQLLLFLLINFNDWGTDGVIPMQTAHPLFIHDYTNGL